MKSYCSLLVAVIYIGVSASGCGNTTSFTSKSSENPKNANANAQGQGQGGQDEIPSTVNNGSDESTNPLDADETPESFKIERQFTTTVVKDSKFTFIPKLGILEQEFSLTSSYENLDRNFSQITRANVSKSYKQGTSEQAKLENLLQSDQGILDLLIVVDDSGSMKEEQANLANNLAPLLTYIKDSDWRIAVVTTDPAKGCSRALMKKGDADLAEAFPRAINAGLDGSGNEQGIRQAVAGLSCATSSFVRPNSTVAVLIVSDEDNCSNGKGCGTEAWNTPTYLTNFLANTLMRRLGTDARVYGLFWEPTKTCAKAASVANQYAKAVLDTNGTAGSICDANYSATLQEISQNVAAILKADFKLKGTPKVGTLSVKVNNVLQPSSAYQMDGDVLRFIVLPPKAATIDVAYTAMAVDLRSSYSMGDDKPAAGTLKVKVKGNLTPANSYTVNAVANTVNFNAMPADLVDISIDFLKDDPLLKEFNLGSTFVDGTLAVKVDNVSTSAYTVDAAGKLKLNVAPLDGIPVNATFRHLIGPDLEYALPLTGTTFKDFKAYDKDTLDFMGVTFGNGKVVVDSANHVEGKTVVLRYRNELSDKKDIVLPSAPILDSIMVDSGDVVCELGNGIEVLDMTLKFSCEFGSEDETTISFKYKDTPITNFEIPELSLLQDYTTQVFINESEIKNFSIVGKVVTISDSVPYDSIVKVKITSKK